MVGITAAQCTYLQAWSAVAVDSLELDVAVNKVSAEAFSVRRAMILQDEGGVRWNQTGKAAATVGVVSV